MNERLKELAEQAGFVVGISANADRQIKRFAELVRDDERAKCAADYLQDCCDAVNAARIEEREAEVICEERRFNDLWDSYAALVNQKPWLWINKHCEVRPWISNRLPADPENWNAVYKKPIRHEWVGLTDDEKTEAIKVCKAPWHSHAVEPIALCNYVEQKLKDKNETI